MTDPVLRLDATIDAIAAHVVDRIVPHARPAIALTGGGTPVLILEELARRPLRWGSVEITLVDDRLVEPSHPASNLGLLTRLLGPTGAQIRPLAEGPIDRLFDLVWCGMGADGHVASIFPQPPLSDDAPPAVIRIVPDPLPPSAPYPRLTLNMAALTRTRELLIVVAGEDKRRMIDRALEGDLTLPVGRLIARADCPITIFWSAR